MKDVRLVLARPAVFVFIALFAGCTSALGFYVGRFFDANRADLSAFFVFLPWVFVVFAPALTMDGLSAERRTGTAEILHTLPLHPLAIIVSKWLTLWLVCLIGLVLTMSLWVCISWLGQPDHGAILSGYFGAALMAGALSALSLAASCWVSNQVLAFLAALVLAALVSFGAIPVIAGPVIAGPVIAELPEFVRHVLSDFSVSVHMVPFWRGVISLKGVMFFVLLGVFGLYAATVLWRPGGLAFLRIALAMLAVFALNSLFASPFLRGVRLDMTQGAVYTLSPAAKAVVAAQEQPTAWTFYFSRGLAASYPDIRYFGAQIEETLRSYAAHSHGRIKLTMIDPGVDNPREDLALAAGMQGLPTDQGLPLYMGLANNNEVGIARFDPARADLLEYDLARTLMPPAAARPALALYDGLDIAGRDWFVTGRKENYVFRQITERFEVQVLDADFTATDLDGRILVLLHPPKFAPEQNTALHEFIDNGGRALVFLDPYSEASARPALNGLPKAGARMASVMPEFLVQNGLGWSGASIVLDRAHAMPVQRNVDEQLLTLRQPAWIGLPPAMLTVDEPIMAQLQRGLIMASAAALRAAPGRGWTGLAAISDTIAFMPAADFAADPDPRTLMQLPPSKAASDGQKPWLIMAKNGVIVTGDADFLTDGFYLQADPVFGPRAQADNADFVLNALDRLADSPALLGLRARFASVRSLGKIDTMRAAAEQALQAAELALAAAPETETETETATATATETRLALRDVRQKFHRRISTTESALEVINIWLVPILFIAVGFGFVYWRRWR